MTKQVQWNRMGAAPLAIVLALGTMALAGCTEGPGTDLINLNKTPSGGVDTGATTGGGYGGGFPSGGGPPSYPVFTGTVSQPYQKTYPSIGEPEFSLSWVEVPADMTEDELTGEIGKSLERWGQVYTEPRTPALL